MSYGISFSSLSIFYSILLTIVYFKKKRVNTIETKLYGAIMITNLIGLILAISCYYCVKYMDLVPILNFIISKLYLVYLLTWITIFTIYIFTISYNKSNLEKYYNKIFTIFIILLVIETIFTFFLPLHYVNSNGLVYSHGPSANLSYIVSIIYITMCFIVMIKNFKRIKLKKYIPLLIFMFGGSIVIIIQRLNPGLLLFTSAETFVTFLMYFTIENPDVKLIEEIQLAKKYSDDSNYEKSLFLFNMTQDIRLPITSINKCVNEMYTFDDSNAIKEKAREIDNYSMELYNIVNSVLDISNVDVKDIKVMDNKYNIKNLLKEVIASNKSKANKKKLEFRFNIDKSLPEYLYGDSIKLKQILNELIDNAIKYTNVGYVSLNVTSVIKTDICRLIIYVEDSGIGIEASRINKIFNSTTDDLTDDKLTISEIQKMLNIIGGTIILNSEYNKGSKFTIVLDQKIDNETKSRELEIIDKYKDLIVDNKKVLLVDDNESSIKMITKLSNSFNIELDSVTSGKECLDKIRNKEKYDLILVDEDMPKLSGYDVIKKLKDINNFNTPVILLTQNSNLEFSEIHLNHGFADLLVKPINKNSLTKVYNKYLNKKD